MDERAWIQWEIPGPPGPRYYQEDVQHMLGVEKSTLNAMIADGRFPEGFKGSPQARPWWSGQILAAWFLIAPLLRRETTETTPEPRKRGKPDQAEPGQPRPD